jgi:hypothetical protein
LSAPGQSIAFLAVLGDVDGAFAEAGAYLQPGGDGDTSFLFRPLARVMRRDRRFLPLALRLGLVSYWRQAKWADFCSEPGLPYSCQQALAKRELAASSRALPPAS